MAKKIASDEIGKVKDMHGNKHDYLAMTLDYSLPGVVLIVYMTKYVKSLIDGFPDKLKVSENFPQQTNYSQSIQNRRGEHDKAKIFHDFITKGMLLCKRGRHFIQPGITFLATRTTEPSK